MEITAIILAGGQGRRFDQQDKGLIWWQDRPLVAHVIDRIQPQVSQIILSCNRHLEEYRQFGYPVFEDEEPGFKGPLTGVYAALQHCQTPLALVVPCDCPQLPYDLVQRLADRLFNDSQADLCLCFDGQRQQYLCVLMRTQLLTSLQGFLASGEAAVKQWYKELHCVEADFSDQAGAFININRPQDLERLP